MDNIKIRIFRACDCMLESRSCELKASSRVECFDWCMLLCGRRTYSQIQHLMSNNVSENCPALGCYFSCCSSNIRCMNESVTVDWTEALLVGERTPVSKYLCIYLCCFSWITVSLQRLLVTVWHVVWGGQNQGNPFIVVYFSHRLDLLCFIWDHPDVFLLKYSRVRSVKTQLIHYVITSGTTCFDSRSHYQVNLEPY